jgi:tetratricopeptide (TPR) repeat protein
MACAKAVESEPSLIPAYINLGAAYYLLHDFGKAVNFFKKGLDVDPAGEILRINYEAALKAKQATESAGALPADVSSEGTMPVDGLSTGDLPGTEISEADDIFMGVPETISSYTLTDIVGLLWYLQGLADFFSASGRRIFTERGIEQSIKNISDALSSLEEDASQANPETEPADVSAPAGDRVSIALLAGMLNHLGELAQGLPQTKERDILKQKMENLIEELNAMALE